MSEPTRYTAAGNGVVRIDPEGLLIAYGHYVELKAELVRLRASSFVTAVPSHQYERVVTAGDEMAKRTEFFQKRWDSDELCQEVEAWNAAKEGKQS